MKLDKKYYIRRNLDSYAETEFAKFLEKKGFQAFYPFRDTGIDILAFDGKNIELYQLKARNELRRNRVYRFSIRKKDLEKLSKLHNAFFILCAVKSNERFDFFKLPISVVKKYINLREETSKKEEMKFLEIKRIGERRYQIHPKRIAKRININDYLL